MEADILSRIYEDLSFLKEKMSVMDNELEDISNDLHRVRPQYLEKLETIRKGGFKTFNRKEKLLDFLDNEI